MLLWKLYEQEEEKKNLSEMEKTPYCRKTYFNHNTNKFFRRIQYII